MLLNPSHQALLSVATICPMAPPRLPCPMARFHRSRGTWTRIGQQDYDRIVSYILRFMFVIGGVESLKARIRTSPAGSARSKTLSASRAVMRLQEEPIDATIPLRLRASSERRIVGIAPRRIAVPQRIKFETSFNKILRTTSLKSGQIRTNIVLNCSRKYFSVLLAHDDSVDF